MEPIDLFALIFGLVWGTGMLILLKRSKSKAKMWPRIYGIGGGMYVFVLLMTGSILRLPKSEFLNYTVENLLWSLPVGIIGYLSGRAFARSRENKK